MSNGRVPAKTKGSIATAGTRGYREAEVRAYLVQAKRRPTGTRDEYLLTQGRDAFQKTLAASTPQATVDRLWYELVDRVLGIYASSGKKAVGAEKPGTVGYILKRGKAAFVEEYAARGIPQDKIDAMWAALNEGLGFKGALKSTLSLAKGALPYAALVASFVPGLGTGTAYVLQATYALSEGKTFTEAMVEGAKASVPGGLAAQAAFNAAADIAQGKKLSDLELDTLAREGINPVSLKADMAASLEGDTAAMGRLDNTLKDIREKDPDLAGAIETGIAVGGAMALQKKKKAVTSPVGIDFAKLRATGKKIAIDNAMLRPGLMPSFWHVPKEKQDGTVDGYIIGLALMPTGLDPDVVVTKVSTTRKPALYAGFAAYIGREHATNLTAAVLYGLDRIKPGALKQSILRSLPVDKAKLSSELRTIAARQATERKPDTIAPRKRIKQLETRLRFAKTGKEIQALETRIAELRANQSFLDKLLEALGL